MLSNGEGCFLAEGIFVQSLGCGQWCINSNGQQFSLEDLSDFYRVLSLLERPIDEVRLKLGSKFPYVNVVSAGLINGSDYWVDLALVWSDNFALKEIEILKEKMESLSLNKKLSQKNRQKIKGFLKRFF